MITDDLLQKQQRPTHLIVSTYIQSAKANTSKQQT